MVATDPSVDTMTTVPVTIDDLLQKYKVGTDGEKKWQKRTHLPPKPSDLCPIYNIPFKSTTKLLQIGLKHEPIENETTSNTAREGSDEFGLSEPNYVNVSLLMNASGCSSDELYECTGFKLLRYRADDTNISLKQLSALTTQAQTKWKELQQLSKKRSLNMNVSTASQPRSKRRQVTPTPQSAITPARSMPKTFTKHTPLSTQRPRNLFRTDDEIQPPSKRCVPAGDGDKNAPPRKRRASMICAKCGRNNSPRSNAVNGSEVRFFAVPSFPTPLTAPTLDTYIKREGKINLRRYVLDRAGCSKDHKGKKYICENHNFEWIKRSRKITWKGEEYTQQYLMLVPEAEGPQSSTIDALTVSKGVGRDRALQRLFKASIMSNVIHNSESLSIEECDAQILELQSETPRNIDDKRRISEEIATLMAAKAEQLSSELAQSNAVIQQMVESNVDKSNLPINPHILQSMGVRLFRGNAEEMRVEGKPFFHMTPIEDTGSNSIPRRHCLFNDEPIVDLTISDKEVFRRTGFASLSALLAYIFVVTNSDIDKILHRVSSLTWFEEWFLHLSTITGEQ